MDFQVVGDNLSNGRGGHDADSSGLSFVGVVTARGGSKGVPRKNLRLAGGRPLIAWSIEAALNSRHVDRVILSTDDAEIAAVGRSVGAEVPFLRPAELARDNSPHSDVILHVADWLDDAGTPADYLINLQPTSPLRLSDDVDAACELAITTGADAVVSVCETKSHPRLMYTVDDAGRMETFLPQGEGYPCRQSFPPVFELNGAVYVIRPQCLAQHRSFCPPGAVAYVMPQSRSFDVDTEWDLSLVDAILAGRHDPRGREHAA